MSDHGCIDCGGITLFKGSDGNTVLNGSGAPAASLGNNGDFYIDTVANEIYGPKTAGVWGSGTPLVGAAGTAGTQGVYGGFSSEWIFDDNTGSATGTGELRFNNVTLSSVTSIFINDTNADAADLEAFLDSFNNSGNFGTIRISKKSDSNVFWMGNVTVEVDSGTEHAITVTHVISNGTFTDADPVIVSFVNTGANLVQPYSIYNALMTQVAAGAPVATVLGNNEIGAIVWTRTGAGAYTGTLVGAFPAGKVWFVTSPSVSGVGKVWFFRNNNDTIFLFTQNTSFVSADDLLSNASIEIRVYN